MGRYVLNARMACVYLTTEPAVPAAPTQAEIDAGVDLVGTGAGEAMTTPITGFAVETSTIATPDFTSLLVGNVGGPQTIPDSSLPFYADDTVEVIRSALAEGNTGFVLFMFDGQAATEECELFPVTVLTNRRRPNEGEAHIFDVNFATGVPTPGVQAA